MNHSVFSDFLNSVGDDEERTASVELFQTEVAAAEKALPPMLPRLVREMTNTSKVNESKRCMKTNVCMLSVFLQQLGVATVSSYVYNVVVKVAWRWVICKLKREALSKKQRNSIMRTPFFLFFPRDAMLVRYYL